MYQVHKRASDVFTQLAKKNETFREEFLKRFTTKTEEQRLPETPRTATIYRAGMTRWELRHFRTQSGRRRPTRVFAWIISPLLPRPCHDLPKNSKPRFKSIKAVCSRPVSIATGPTWPFAIERAYKRG